MINMGNMLRLSSLTVLGIVGIGAVGLSFTNRRSPGPPPDVISRLETVNINTLERIVIYEEKRHLEAPNWVADGTFIVNSDGKLYRIPATGGHMKEIPTGFADRCNNDHGISPDGKTLIISHNDPTVKQGQTSRIYTLPIEGGTPKAITENTPSYWHGVSPDGQTLIYTAQRNGDFDIYAISIDGGAEQRLTDTPGLDDGPDFSPDGAHIYFNSIRTGRMEIWRMKPDGTEPVQITDDSYSNWFPHPSPDGKWLVFLSYLEDQGSGHPFGKDVKLRIMALPDGEVRDLTDVFLGGQGTINVPSWSSNSLSVAFVTYELAN